MLAQVTIALHLESGLGLKQRTEWEEVQEAEPTFQLFDDDWPPRVGTRYWETKLTKNRAIYRSFLACQTAETMERYHVVSAALRLWPVALGLDIADWVFQIFGISLGDTWWVNPSPDFLDDEGNGNADWAAGTIAASVAGEEISLGTWLDIPVDVSALIASSGMEGGYSFFRLCSSDESTDPGTGATPVLDDEELGGWCEFDGPADDHPPVLILTIELDGTEQETGLPLSPHAAAMAANIERVGAEIQWRKRRGDICPCVEETGTGRRYNPQWHRNNPTAEDCGGAGIINRTVTLSSFRAIWCPPSEAAAWDIDLVGNYEEDDHVLIAAESAGLDEFESETDELTVWSEVYTLVWKRLYRSGAETLFLYALARSVESKEGVLVGP